MDRFCMQLACQPSFSACPAGTLGLRMSTNSVLLDSEADSVADSRECSYRLEEMSTSAGGVPGICVGVYVPAVLAGEASIGVCSC